MSGAGAGHRQWNKAKMDREGLDVEELFDYQGVKGVKGFARDEPSDAQIQKKLEEKQMMEDIEKFDIDLDSKVPIARQLRRAQEAEQVHEDLQKKLDMKKEEEDAKARAEARKKQKKTPEEKKKEAEERRARLKAKKDAEKNGEAPPADVEGDEAEGA